MIDKLVAYTKFANRSVKVDYRGRTIRAKPGDSAEFILENYARDVSDSAKDMKDRKDISDSVWDERLERLFYQKEAVNQSATN